MDGLSNWTCVPCKLFSIGTTNVTFLGKDAKTFGLVALHPPSQSLIISFRGTRNLDNWTKDLLFAKPNVPFPSAPDGAKVHYGFLKGYEQLQKGFRKKVARFRRAEPSFTIRFFGHSLGGALAVLAAIDLMTSNHSLVSFSFYVWRSE